MNEKDECKKQIIEMIEKIENEKFLRQIFIILKNHIKRRGD